ncbi:tyrosine-type recombinase/integrase [Gordonia liuliyuniae]|uniref:Site-specific integrase n=1 Tax=Gordonia liuliyuniae TaxID=2911517 RepID=A0ABS9IT45_9ACTN|nr:site-specific integrase [Gordonia liuliyuniae]MCF8588737.1 site-specific integrase [Gordonia liuliyuniae]
MTKRNGSSRRRGVGSITSYTTKAGTRWRYQLWVPVDWADPDGGLRQVGKGGFTSATDADDALDDAKAKLRARQSFIKNVATVADYADAWIDARPLERSTTNAYKRIVKNHLRPYRIGKTAVDKVTASMIASHYAGLRRTGRRDAKGRGEGLSENSVSKVHALLSSLLDSAVEDGLMPVNVARRRGVVNAPTGRTIRAGKPEVHAWTGAQLRSFLQWSAHTGDVLHPLWTLAAGTGARRSELLALQWRDVDLAAGQVTIRRALDTGAPTGTTKTTKTGSVRTVDVDAETMRVVKAWRRELAAVTLDLTRPTAFVFPNVQTGGARSPNEVSRRWRTRIKNARAELGENSLPAIRLHDVRHTHASILLSAGVPVHAVAKRLGHATPTVTLNTYAHVLEGAQRDAADKFAAAVNGG